MNRRLALFGAAALVFAIVALAWRMRPGGNAAGVTLFVSGDTRGYLEPCGCRRDQAGGLPGRMTLIQQNTSGDRLLVDVGNLTSGDRSYELLKLRYLLMGMKHMDYDAVNIGRRESSLDRDTLAKTVSKSGAPFVTCNVLDRATNRPMAEAYRVVNAAGMRVGITGIAESPYEEVGPGLRLRPAAEALAETLPALRRQCDYVIVLAYASQESLRAIAEQFHEIDCLLGGDVAQSSEKAETINRAVAFNVTEKGKVLGRLTFMRRDGGLLLTGSSALKVADTIPPAPEMTALLKGYREELRQRNVELASEEGLDPIVSSQTTADTYAGEAACAGCHAKAHQVTAASAHAHSYETLAARNAQYDPECLRCHTVGYGARDGFVNVERTPKLASVQCESCHGRGGEHVKAMLSGAKTASTFRPVTPNTCVRCHDRENSENFRYETYWPKIAHGKER